MTEPLDRSKLTAVDKALVACGAQSPQFPVPRLAEWFLAALREAGFDLVERIAARVQPSEMTLEQLEALPEVRMYELYEDGSKTPEGRAIVKFRRTDLQASPASEMIGWVDSSGKRWTTGQRPDGSWCKVCALP